MTRYDEKGNRIADPAKPTDLKLHTIVIKNENEKDLTVKGFTKEEMEAAGFKEVGNMYIIETDEKKAKDRLEKAKEHDEK